MKDIQFYERENRAIGKFMPGDKYSDLSVETAFSEINSDLCLLPFYLANYEHRGRLYKFIVNGQTGKAGGDTPFSWAGVGIVVGIGLAVLVIIMALFGIIALQS